MFDSVIKLVSEKKIVDDYGDLQKQCTERTVFAEIKSINQSEFYQAQATGLRPEIKFVLSDYLEYQNEELVKFQDFSQCEEETYKVIRTYRNGNSLELVCKRGVE